MKAWSENLLTRILDPDKEKLWHSLHLLMHCRNESHFEVHLQKLYNDFQHIPIVNVYLRSGWSVSNVPWRTLWPKFGRLFSYGGMNTTNHIERYWEWIKYTLLQRRVNRSLRDLIGAIVESAVDGTRGGRPTLLDHFQQVQLIS